MRIQDCQMDISCQRTASETREASYVFRVEHDGEFKDMLKSYAKDGKIVAQEVEPRASAVAVVPESWSSGAIASGDESRRRRVDQLLQEMITRLFAMLTAGDKDCCCDKDEDSTGLPDLGQGKGASARTPAAGDFEAQPRMPRVRVVAWESETNLKVRESESTTVCASGSVRTADGRCIDFDLEVAMQRQYEADYQQKESGTWELKDPLVLNFPGKAAELADTRFDFDLDADGDKESVAGLGRGSAFLALDRNGDGAINDGRELFGALSGNGFADLKAYDTDGNNWIDEADAIYSQLRLWQPGADTAAAGKAGQEGQGAGLQTLQEAGVGALWLGSVQSEFSLKDGDKQQQGQVRQTGVWLAENGEAGSLQQVDLATT